MKKNKEVFALDGHCLKRKPSGPEAMYKYLEKHCINSNMRYAIQEEKMKLNDSVRQKYSIEMGRNVIYVEVQKNYV